MSTTPHLVPVPVSGTRPQPAGSKLPTVLFVDDEPPITRSLSALFRRTGQYAVLTANSARDALELLGTHDIDVIVSDQRMPGMTGVELLREFATRSPRTMRILLTAWSDLSAITASINEGEVFRFVQKPWGNDLLATVAVAASASLAPANEPVHGAPDLVPAAAQGTGVGILVVDDGRELLDLVRADFGSTHPVHVARHADQAIALLEQHEGIGIVVSDVRVADEDMTDVIKVIKATHPAVLSVMVTALHDGPTVIDLINEGQLFRLIGKPVKPSVLRLALGSALRKHEFLRNEPGALARHRPAEAPAVAERLQRRGLLKRLLGSVRHLFSFGFGTRSAAS